MDIIYNFTVRPLSRLFLISLFTMIVVMILPFFKPMMSSGIFQIDVTYAFAILFGTATVLVMYQGVYKIILIHDDSRNKNTQQFLCFINKYNLKQLLILNELVDSDKKGLVKERVFRKVAEMFHGDSYYSKLENKLYLFDDGKVINSKLKIRISKQFIFLTDGNMCADSHLIYFSSIRSFKILESCSKAKGKKRYLKIIHQEHWFRRKKIIETSRLDELYELMNNSIL